MAAGFHKIMAASLNSRLRAASIRRHSSPAFDLPCWFGLPTKAPSERRIVSPSGIHNGNAISNRPANTDPFSDPAYARERDGCGARTGGMGLGSECRGQRSRFRDGDFGRDSIRAECDLIMWSGGLLFGFA